MNTQTTSSKFTIVVIPYTKVSEVNSGKAITSGTVGYGLSSKVAGAAVDNSSSNNKKKEHN